MHRIVRVELNFAFSLHYSKAFIAIFPTVSLVFFAYSLDFFCIGIIQKIPSDWFKWNRFLRFSFVLEKKTFFWIAPLDSFRIKPNWKPMLRRLNQVNQLCECLFFFQITSLILGKLLAFKWKSFLKTISRRTNLSATFVKESSYRGRVQKHFTIVFSRRFMKWNATIIVTLFFVFLSTRTDQNSSTEVLQNIIASKCTIWSSELNQKGFFCFSA